MANGSGTNQVKINDLERANNDDINLLQANSGKRLSNALTTNLTKTRNGSWTGGYDKYVKESELVTANDTPLQAVVLNGLLLDIGTSITIDSGSIVTAFTDSNTGTNDNNVMVVDYDGSAAGLAFTANSNSGQARWDVVECRPVTTTTTASRGIWNETSKNFNDQTVDKFIENTLEFRINIGTSSASNASLPSSAGWLPIATIFHPDVTSSFADCIIFDVRPLKDDLVNSIGPDESQETIRNFKINSSATLIGTIDGFSPDNKYSNSDNASYGNKLSGEIMQCASTAGPGNLSLDNGIINIGDIGTNWNTTYQITTWFYLSLLFPFNLPRWVPYSQTVRAGQSRRVPVGCGGIPVVSAGGFDTYKAYTTLPAFYKSSEIHNGVFITPFYTGSAAPQVLETLCQNNNCWFKSTTGVGVTSISTVGSWTQTVNRTTIPEGPFESIKLRINLQATALTDDTIPLYMTSEDYLFYIETIGHVSGNVVNITRSVDVPINSIDSNLSINITKSSGTALSGNQSFIKCVSFKLK